MGNRVNGLFQFAVGLLAIMVATWNESVEFAIFGAVVALIGGLYVVTAQLVDAIRELKPEAQTQVTDHQAQATE